MKIIMQTNQHVTVRFTWRELALLDMVVTAWRWGVSHGRIGGHKPEWNFTTVLRDRVQRAVDRREIDHYKSTENK